MQNLLNYLRQNSTAVFLFLAAAAVGTLLFSCSGLRVSDYIPVKVPQAVQESLSLPQEITLTESDQHWQGWQLYVKQETENLKLATQQFDQAIADGEKSYALIYSVLDMGLKSPEADAARSAIGGVPGGALILGGLTTLGAFFLPAPGTSKRLKEAEDKGWDLAKSEGKA